MSQIEHRRKEEGHSLVEFYAETSTAALPRDVLELLNPIREALARDSVHRQAIFRLLDIWPEAKVRVVHLRPVIDRHGLESDRLYTKGERAALVDEENSFPFAPFGGQTQVIILPNPDAAEEDAVVGFAECNPDDQYDKRLGTTIAFNRALKKLSRRTQLADAGYEEIGRAD